MKRWIIGMALAVLLLGVGAVTLAWWRPGYLLAATAMVSTEFAAEWMMNWRERMAKNTPEQQKRNLEYEIIRVELNEHWYDIPMSYIYGQAIEKHGRWPKAKPERVKVGVLTLSLLLPDLKPYYPEDDAHWKVRGHGDRIEVTITNSLGKPDWFQRYRGKYFGGQDQYSTRKEEIHGLVIFAGHGYTSDTYFPADDSTELTMSCDKQPKSADFFPSCNVRTNYRPGIVLDYYFSKDYLPYWREIDLKLKALFDRFEHAAKSGSTDGEK